MCDSSFQVLFCQKTLETHSSWTALWLVSEMDSLADFFEQIATLRGRGKEAEQTLSFNDQLRFLSLYSPDMEVTFKVQFGGPGMH